MKKTLINYSGVILLYLVVFFGVLAITSNIKEINNTTAGIKAK